MSEDINKGYTYEYPRPALTADCVVFGFDGSRLNILLIERGLEPFIHQWALPGGFMREDETIEECAGRELEEETGLKVSLLKPLRLFSTVDRDPRGRVVTMAFYSMVREQQVHGGDDAAKAKWFHIDEAMGMRLAFDHNEIVKVALTHLRKDVEESPVGFGLLDETFTLPQLQTLYEAVLGTTFDRRNFHKKMMQQQLIQKVEDEPEQIVACHTVSMVKMDISELFLAPEKAPKTRGRKPTLFKFTKSTFDDDLSEFFSKLND